MAGTITIKFSVMKGGVAHLGMKSPIYIPGPVEPNFGPGRYIYFEGFSVDEHGKQHYLDATVAYRQTTLRCIEYLRRFGYDDYQVYLLLSCAPVQGHIAGLVDVGWPKQNDDGAQLTRLRFPMPAPLWGYRSIFSTSTSCHLPRPRRGTWEAAPSVRSCAR